MMDEGYIKFNCQWQSTPPLDEKSIRSLNDWRSKLFHMGLIGVYPDGIGFGNISERIGASDQFMISGTQTGSLTVLTNEHYTKVLYGDFNQNLIVCEGPVQASSESLTHLAVYQASPNTKAVIHVHHHQFWEKLLNHVPTTRQNVAYGTPAMAHEVLRLFREEALEKKRIFVMAGHEDGVVAIGENLQDAGSVLMSYYGQ